MRHWNAATLEELAEQTRNSFIKEQFLEVGAKLCVELKLSVVAPTILHRETTSLPPTGARRSHTS